MGMFTQAAYLLQENTKWFLSSGTIIFNSEIISGKFKTPFRKLINIKL
jgi:hypothetical protein